MLLSVAEEVDVAESEPKFNPFTGSGSRLDGRPLSYEPEPVSHSVASSSSGSLITSLPEELVVDILARVPRCYYPTLSLVCKHSRSLIASPELYARRSLSGCTEACIYGVFYNRKKDNCHWCILCKKADRSSFVLIQSIPPIPHNSSYPWPAVVGSRVYYVVQDRNNNMKSSSMSTMDCRFHTVHPLPSIPTPIVCTVAFSFDRKVYLVGDTDGSGEGLSERIMVLDTETETWESVMTKADVEVEVMWGNSVVMGDKVYMKESHNTFAYRPKENKLETDEMLNSVDWGSSCVVDNVMYYYCFAENQLIAYDPKQRCWTMVKGVEELLDSSTDWWSSRAVNYGGKLALFLPKAEYSDGIFCAEITFERRQGGEIWGKVESYDVVVDDDLILLSCLAVMV